MRILYFTILLSSLTACGESIDDVDPKSLKSACDCAKAAEIIITERLDITESSVGKDAKDLDSAALKKKWLFMLKKEEEVQKVCNGNLEFNKCPEWKEIKKKLMGRGNEINKKVNEKLEKSQGI